jgi:hypothetical protein
MGAIGLLTPLVSEKLATFDECFGLYGNNIEAVRKCSKPFSLAAITRGSLLIGI